MSARFSVIIILLTTGIFSPVLARQTGFELADHTILQSCLEETVNARDNPREDGTFPDFSHCVGRATAACQLETPTGGSAEGIATCNNRELAWWDLNMSLEYADLQDMLDPALIQKLGDVQRVWLNFRDKNCGFAGEFVNGAPLALVLSSFCRLRMTGERTIELIKFRDWTQML